MLHAWWGVNDTMRSVCGRLADAGFTAFAPDVYHRKVADTIPDARALTGALDFDRAGAEIAAVAAFLEKRSGTAGSGPAVIGFSLGASFALDLSIADPDRIRSVVLFYGTGAGDFGRSKATYLGHFAERDEFEPQAEVDALEQSLRSAGCPVTFHRYSGTGHWFFEPDRVDAFNQAAASLAWDRTLEFLRSS